MKIKTLTAAIVVVTILAFIGFVISGVMLNVYSMLIFGFTTIIGELYILVCLLAAIWKQDKKIEDFKKLYKMK